MVVIKSSLIGNYYRNRGKLTAQFFHNAEGIFPFFLGNLAEAVFKGTKAEESTMAKS